MMLSASVRVGGAKKEGGGRGTEKMGVKLTMEGGLVRGLVESAWGVGREDDVEYQERMLSLIRASSTSACRYWKCANVSAPMFPFPAASKEETRQLHLD